MLVNNHNHLDGNHMINFHHPHPYPGTDPGATPGEPPIFQRPMFEFRLFYVCTFVLQSRILQMLTTENRHLKVWAENVHKF